MSRATLFSVLAFAAAVVAAVIVVFAPTYSTCDSDAACQGASAFAVNGWWIFVVVSVPVVLALIPVLIHRKVVRAVAATVLWICCVVALFSVGIFFVPAAILMTIAATRRDAVAAPDASITDR